MQFLELAEAAEFEIYEKYADDITSLQSKEALQNLLMRQDVSLRLSIHSNQQAHIVYIIKCCLLALHISISTFFHLINCIVLLHRQVNYYRLAMDFEKLLNFICPNYC